MERKLINELLKEWGHRITFVRGEILADLTELSHKKKNRYGDSPKDSADNNLDTERTSSEVQNKQKENEARITEIESILKKEGVDPFKSSIATLLFVDTESSNCFNDVIKMCEYGQFGTDLDFNEKASLRKDIMMNPGRDGRFCLTGRKGRKNLLLSHHHNDYWKTPSFEEYYGDISFWLRQEGAMVFMWASENDVQAILDQCVRYKATKISFVSYDVQQIFMKEFPEFGGVPSLEKAAAFLNINIDGIVQHKPDEDSLLTMLVLKGIIEKTGKSILQLVYDCPSCQYESTKAYAYMKKRHKEKTIIRAEINKRKAELAPCNNELNELLSMPVPEETPRENQFAVSRKMKMNVDKTLPLIRKWVENGYYLKRNLSAAYLVAFDEEEKEYLERILDTSELEVVLVNQFDKVCLPKT